MTTGGAGIERKGERVSRLSNLLREVEKSDPQLAADLEQEFAALSERRAFGLNFERHVPESVELPGRPIRRGDKVRFLAERGEPANSVDQDLWRVVRVTGKGKKREAELVRTSSRDAEPERATRAVNDLVGVAEFRDPIYPGLVSTGKVERGGAAPFHTVINAENFHALEALLYTHEGKVDAIYIDPPYNTGAKDWKYNNDYVDGEDAYRHSKWLAFMERRLKLAKRLLNPDNSVLIVTIDEKEYLRLGLLLEQVFLGATIQMVSATINPKGASRPQLFARVDEFIYFVLIGDANVPDMTDPNSAGKPVRWPYLRRSDNGSLRGTRPRQFYPVFVDPNESKVVGVGEPIGPNIDMATISAPDGLVAVFPVREDGQEMEWGLTGPSLMKAAKAGFVRATLGHAKQPFTIAYLTAPSIKKVENGEFVVADVRPDGSKVVVAPQGKASRPRTVWAETSHSAGDYGTKLLGALLPGRKFPFPKSLYAVEDALRYFVADKPGALIVDFFSGSGTTAHAVMRLNKQNGDAGRRRSISVTNNEVSADEQAGLRKQGLRPGDPEWEALGICEYITKPRLEAAVSGETPDGESVKGEYKFTDEFPMSDGFEANVEFFTMTYEASRAVAHHRAFEKIAPLLWLRAGAEGRRIESDADGYDVADTYGILFDLDHARGFVTELRESPRAQVAFVVTDDDRAFQAVCAELPAEIEAVRLYSSYLTNFELTARGE